MKLLTPLIEYSGLEEDEELQDKWAILLGNMVDSEQNIENHVFPYILSQISKDEFEYVEQAHMKKVNETKAIRIMLEKLFKLLPSKNLELNEKIMTSSRNYKNSWTKRR